MIEQIGVALPFTAFYTTLGLGTTGLTVTVDVFRNGAIIVTGASAAEAGDGLYTYTLASGSNTVEGIYVAVFKTATVTVDQQHLVAGWTVGKAGVEYLDASIATVQSKTNGLPTDPADESLIEAAIEALSTYISVFIAKSSEVADISAIKAVIDQFRFTVANQVDANALTGGGGGGATPAEVWAYATRSLTQSAAQVADIVAGDEITITNSATITIALTGLGSLTGATQIWFCAKRNKDADDNMARFLVSLNGGLLRTNGNAGVAGDGTLVVDNPTTGNITVTVKPASAQLIAAGADLHWDVKAKFSADDVRELSSGVINIVQAVTHSV